MKTRFISYQLAASTFILSLILLLSCGRENSVSGDEEVQVATASATSDAEAESSFTEFFDDAMGVNNDVAVAGSGAFFGRTDTLVPVPHCYTVTVTHPNSTFFPAHVVV